VPDDIHCAFPVAYCRAEFPGVEDQSWTQIEIDLRNAEVPALFRSRLPSFFLKM
jgi:hypothetical protein